MGVSAAFKLPDFTEISRRFFEPKLIEISLGEEQIASASLPQLQQSLERVNECIAHPESFGVLKLKMGVGGAILTTTESHIEIGILPLLLQRKKLILDRIAILTGEEKVGDLRSVAERADPAVRDELQQKINELDAEAKKWRTQALAADDAQKKAQLDQQAELARIEVFERRSRVWQGFLERQSVATIVGAILLIAIFVFIAASSAFGTTVPELINNAFLVILGYFFGQASSDAIPKPKPKKEGE
jgi:hypothetical protein